MDIGSIFLNLALLIGAVIFISRPFFKRYPYSANALPSEEEHEESALLAERDRVIDALYELDFDYALGKIPEVDYPKQRKAFLDRGADILRELDKLQGAEDESSISADNDIDDRLEAAVIARRSESLITSDEAAAAGTYKETSGAVLALEADDDLEVMIANRRRNRVEKAAGFCPKCGGPVQKSDIFCPICGARQS